MALRNEVILTRRKEYIGSLNNNKDVIFSVTCSRPTSKRECSKNQIHLGKEKEAVKEAERRNSF